MSNKNKGELLGMPVSTAQNRLRKMVLFRLLSEFGLNICYRCGDYIEAVKQLSIEHKIAWRSSPNPTDTFWDLNNIAFSHLSCNVAEANASKTHCPKGHEYSKENMYNTHYRICKICTKPKNLAAWHNKNYAERRRLRRQRNREEGKIPV